MADEDNSVLTDHEEYIGVDPIYRNAAEDVQTPDSGDGDPEQLDGESDEAFEARKQALADAAEVSDRVKENEEALKSGVNMFGSGYDAEHPHDQVTPADTAVAQQRAVQDAQVAQANEFLNKQKSAGKQSAPKAAPKDEAPKE